VYYKDTLEEQHTQNPTKIQIQLTEMKYCTFLNHKTLKDPNNKNECKSMRHCPMNFWLCSLRSKNLYHTCNAHKSREFPSYGYQINLLLNNIFISFLIHVAKTQNATKLLNVDWETNEIKYVIVDFYKICMFSWLVCSC